MLHLCESLGKATAKIERNSIKLPIMSKDGTMFPEGNNFCVEYVPTACAILFSSQLTFGTEPVLINNGNFVIPISFFVKNGLIPNSNKEGKVIAKEIVFEAYNAFTTNEPNLTRKHILPNMPILEDTYFDIPREEYKEAIEFYANSFADHSYILRFYDTRKTGVAYVIKTPLHTNGSKKEDGTQLSFLN